MNSDAKIVIFVPQALMLKNRFQINLNEKEIYWLRLNRASVVKKKKGSERLKMSRGKISFVAERVATRSKILTIKPFVPPFL